MSAADVAEREAPAPPPPLPEPATGKPRADDVVQLEERRRDAYRVG